MGTWGVGAFENDGAMDWTFQLQKTRGTAILARVLRRAAETAQSEAVDLDDGLEALAAAEVVAAARGHPSKKLPADAQQWMHRRKFVADRSLSHLAAQAVRRVARQSELKEQWAGEPKWAREVAQLLKRLRADPRPVIPPRLLSPEATTARRALRALGAVLGPRADGNVTVAIADGKKRLTDKAMAHFRHLRDLRKLCLAATPITDAGLAHLRGLRRLRILELRDTAIGDAGLEQLSRLGCLKTLELSKTAITDEGLQHLVNLKFMRRLMLARTQVTDGGLAYLGAMERLEDLDLHETRVTGSGLQHLGARESLRWLDLRSTAVTDAALASLSGFHALDILLLDRTKITGSGFVDLQDVPRLRILSLDDTAVTDQVLDALRGLPALESVSLAGTRVNPATRKSVAGVFKIDAG